MRNFARVGSSAQTANSGSGGSNPEKAMAAIPGCAIGFESGRLLCGLRRLCLGPHLEKRSGTEIPAPVITVKEAAEMMNVHHTTVAMFDSENPGRSGGLAGDSYASVLENHPRYPNLRRIRDAELLARLDRVVEQKIKCVGLLQQFGFDEAGIALYHAAALSAFRAALPTN